MTCKVGDRVRDLAVAPADRRTGVVLHVWDSDGRTVVRVRLDGYPPTDVFREPYQLDPAQGGERT